MAKKKVYANDSGTSILLDCEIDITNCNSCRIFYNATNGVSGAWSGVTWHIGGVTKAVLYVTSAGDVTDVLGKWKLQAGVSGLAGFSGRGRTVDMMVYDRFK